MAFVSLRNCLITRLSRYAIFSLRNCTSAQLSCKQIFRVYIFFIICNKDSGILHDSLKTGGHLGPAGARVQLELPLHIRWSRSRFKNSGGCAARQIPAHERRQDRLNLGTNASKRGEAKGTLRLVDHFWSKRGIACRQASWAAWRNLRFFNSELNLSPESASILFQF